MGIENGGNGIGYLYVTGASGAFSPGSPYDGSYANTTENFILVRGMALISAPLSSERLATGSVKVNVGGGTITNVTVNGVGIMGAVAASGATPALIAADLASKINSATSAPDYDAQVVDDTVFIIAKAGTGSTPNGFAVVSSVTAPTTTTDTNMGGGSPASGVYDAADGIRFFINATSSATEGDLTGSEEITKYLAMRGVQNALPAETVVLFDNGATINRTGSLMVITVDTEGAAATDTLETIITGGFSDNDLLIIKGANSARVVTIDDNAGNIELSNNQNFSTFTEDWCIILRYESSTDKFYEVTRSQVFPNYGTLRSNGIPEPQPGVDEYFLPTNGTVDIDVPVDKGYIVVTQSPVLIGNVVFQPDPTPASPYMDGDEIWLDYRATPTLGGNTVTLFGITLTSTQAAEGRIIARAKYRLSNTTWYSYIYYKNNSKDLVDTVALATKESSLGNPAADGYILSSTAAGARTWIPNTAQQNIISNSVGDVGTDADMLEKVLKTYSLPANYLVTTGDKIIVKAYFTTAANANGKTIRLYFGATVIDTYVGNFNAASFWVEFEVIRTGAATEFCKASLVSDATTALVDAGFNTAAESLAGTVVVKVSGQNAVAAANDIVCKQMDVELRKV